MQPMPQSICAIVCIYVCFRPTQRLLPGVSGVLSDGDEWASVILGVEVDGAAEEASWGATEGNTRASFEPDASGLVPFRRIAATAAGSNLVLQFMYATKARLT